MSVREKLYTLICVITNWHSNTKKPNELCQICLTKGLTKDTGEPTTHCHYTGVLEQGPHSGDGLVVASRPQQLLHLKPSSSSHFPCISSTQLPLVISLGRQWLCPPS